MQQAWRVETWMRWNDFQERQDTIQLTHLEPRAHEKNMRVWHVSKVRAVRCALSMIRRVSVLLHHHFSAQFLTHISGRPSA